MLKISMVGAVVVEAGADEIDPNQALAGEKPLGGDGDVESRSHMSLDRDRRVDSGREKYSN
jgi:hypothetical protein